MASPTPVLPLVGSMIVDPGPRSPSRSAASTIVRAGRSLELPPGFVVSILAMTSHATSRPTRPSFTMGVWPIISSGLSATSMSGWCITDLFPLAPLTSKKFFGLASHSNDFSPAPRCHESTGIKVPERPRFENLDHGPSASLDEEDTETVVTLAAHRLDDCSSRRGSFAARSRNALTPWTLSSVLFESMTSRHARRCRRRSRCHDAIAPAKASSTRDNPLCPHR